MDAINGILIIGAGRVGTALFRGIREKTNIPTYLADIEPVKDQSDFQNDLKRFFYLIKEKPIPVKDLIFIAVPDDNIGNVVAHLNHSEVKNSIVLHTSGAIDAELLNPLKKHKAHIGSFHPLQTFSEMFSPVSVWENIFCTYQGDDEGYFLCQKLAKLFKAELGRVSARQKIAIHTAGVLASNLHFALLSAAEEILDTAGLSTNIKSMLLPIISQTINNYEQHSINDALTGPLKRGDIQTITKHLQHLGDHRKIKEIYLSLSKAILDNPNIETKNKSKIMEILNDFE